MSSQDSVSSVNIEAILEKHAHAKRDALIPILQEVQEACGFVPQEAVTLIGRRLELPTSKIYGVATFYNQFRFQPKGKYHIMVCRGTACHVKGSFKLMESAMKLLKLKPGETSRDKMFSLEVVACMGACGLGPVLNLNGEFHAKVTLQKLSTIITECREKEVAHA